MTTTLSPPEPPAHVAPRRTSTMVVVGAVVVVALVAAAIAVTSRIAADRTADESRIQHHRGLSLAAVPQLERALQRALRQPVADRPASVLPWPDGPQLGPGQPDIDAQGSPVIRTTLVRSAPDAVVAEMVVRSDGYTTTLVEKWFRGGRASDACSYGDLPGQPPENNAATCQGVIDSVPLVNG